MRIILKIIFILLVYSLTVSAQQNNKIIVLGRVLDNNTGAPLEDVNVFLDNTTIGTTSGKDGRFIINNVPFGSYYIIFSYVGYETESRNFSSYNPRTFEFNISLKQKAINLKQVNVTGSVPEDWKNNLAIFKKIFIGETDNANKTKILNPEVLNFVKDKKENILKVYSDSVLKVENRALGYMLYIVLDSLVYTPGENIKYMFYPRFKELVPASENEKLEWEKNRQNTYLNSPKYFYYALVHKQLDKDYFSTQEVGYLNLSCNSDSTIYTLNFTGRLKVQHYLNPPSYLFFYYPYVSIDKYGNLLTSSYDVATSGDWAKQRIANLLPKNYVYKGH